MPSQEETDPSYRVAGLLAFHLVSQVLDEAHIIANAAADSGRPWHYLSMRKNMKPNLTYVIPPGEDTCDASTGEHFIEGDDIGKAESDDNILVTSTPQKASDDKSKIETLIGQGDEEDRQNELSNSTSMFINHLFDMSDVEHVICDDTEALQHVGDPNVLLAQAMIQMMESFAGAALKSADPTHSQEEESDKLPEKCSSSTGHSSFSFLTDELTEDSTKEVVFYVDDDVPSCTDKIVELPQDQMTSQRALQQHEGLEEIKIENSEHFENTYLTLNRKSPTLGDYDQCSDEDGYPILQDPKGMIMQEIELLTANTSDDTNNQPDEEPEEEDQNPRQKSDLNATSAVSASSRKSNLVRRCRLQGARLLACIRGWWRRKTTVKRKEGRTGVGAGGSRSGLCPLSPGARRRARSLMDQRSPVPSRVAWKFNTLNEALVNSSVWKDYTFETNPNESGNV